MTRPCVHCGRPYLRKLSTATNPKHFCTKGCENCHIAHKLVPGNFHEPTCGTRTGKYEERYPDA